jgi:protein TonB
LIPIGSLSDSRGPEGTSQPRRIIISPGVSQGLLVKSVAPEYPEVARNSHVSGLVVLQATIGKDGKLANLKVVSGPALLQQAAMDSVKQWVYRPYMLNGAPVEVETTINVVFNLPNRQ